MACYRDICVFCVPVFICLQFIATHPYPKPKNVPHTHTRTHTFTFRHAMWSTLMASLASRLQFEVWNDTKLSLFTGSSLVFVVPPVSSQWRLMETPFHPSVFFPLTLSDNTGYPGDIKWDFACHNRIFFIWWMEPLRGKPKFVGAGRKRKVGVLHSC